MNTLKINTPSGRVFTIREQNGADGEILTASSSTPDEIDLINRFLTGIILNEVIDGSEFPVSLETVKNLLLRDRYCILLKSRIHSLGPELKFKYDLGEPFGEESFIEDLNLFSWEYDTPFPYKGDPNYFRYRIEPYKKKLSKDSCIQVNINGVEYLADYTTAKSEEYISHYSKINNHVNLELLARNFRSANGVSVRNFESFSARDMAKIRSEILAADPRFGLMTSIETPNGSSLEIPILSLPDFFFPSLL